MTVGRALVVGVLVEDTPGRAVLTHVAADADRMLVLDVAGSAVAE